MQESGRDIVTIKQATSSISIRFNSRFNSPSEDLTYFTSAWLVLNLLHNHSITGLCIVL